jgi:hypothetical protein
MPVVQGWGSIGFGKVQNGGSRESLGQGAQRACRASTELPRMARQPRHGRTQAGPAS